MFLPDEVTAGHVIYPPAGKLGPRWQTNVQFVFIHRGSMTVWVDGAPSHVRSGSVTLLLPQHHERFAFAPSVETEHSWFHLTYHQITEELETVLQALPHTIGLSHAMSELIQSALRLRTINFGSAHDLLRAIGFHCLCLYIHECQLQTKEYMMFRIHDSVAQAQQYIEEHIGQVVTLEHLAQVAAISPAHLIRLFREHLGKTPMAYLWERRVARGIELLRFTGLPIGVIAAQCGFKTSYHFSRRVRLATGDSPLQLRQQSWQ
jgi:AraC family transcriptional regulator of arabinose operon